MEVLIILYIEELIALTSFNVVFFLIVRMINLENINDWESSLGLLPIQLLPENASNDKYILLNGGTGDFCLQLAAQLKDPEYYYSSAWSSNTKNFVVFQDKHLNIYNWKNKKIETVRTELIEKNFYSFYEYLLESSFTTELDIVPFVVGIFKQLRNLTSEYNTPTRALNLLFLLLASLQDDSANIDVKKWGLTDNHYPAGFDAYIDQFKNGLWGLKPDLDLILRHSSGVLFQEAQKEALFFDRQTDMFSGTLSGAYDVKKKLYSSIHYTPSYVARTIVENTLKNVDLTKATLTIFDPACGSSEFLMEVLKQLKARSFAGKVIIKGWDSSDTAINTSQFLLKYESREWGDNITVDLRLIEDSLTGQWGSDNDIILMNPPFVSWELLDKMEREIVKISLGDTIDGKPNQASAFFYLATQSITENGVIGCVLPSSLLSLSSYTNMRNKIGENITLSLIGKLGNFVFGDALTDISILIAHKPKTDEKPLLIWAKNEKGAASEALRNVRRYQKQNLPFLSKSNYDIYKPTIFPVVVESWKPVSYSECELIKRIEIYVGKGKLCRIQDVFNVKQGIRTGNNSVFKITSLEYQMLPEKERTFFRPAIDNDAIFRGEIKLGNYLWYPYLESGLIINTEEELKQAVPFYYQYHLFPNRAAFMVPDIISMI